MENSAIRSSIASPMRSRPAKKSRDVTILIAAACMAVGAVVAIYALTVSGPASPETLATMVAFP